MKAVVNDDPSPIVLIEISKIIVPVDRQRRKAEADEALVKSLHSLGLINPIIINQKKELVAGERRLDAAKKAGWTRIPSRIFEKLSPIQRFEVELQENIARKQLTWQEEARAVGTYHQMRVERFPSWNQMGTAEALGISTGGLSLLLTVAGELENEDVAGCPTLRGAFNLITARAERASIAAQSRGLIVADALSSGLMPNMPVGATKEERTAALLQNVSLKSDVHDTVEEMDASIKLINAGRIATAALEAQKRQEIVSDLVITGDFIAWAADYTGPRFDVLHVDFPYGKNYAGARTRRTGKVHIAPVYADDPDVYFSLVAGLLAVQDRVAFDAAHCLFWFDMQYYQWTIDQFIEAGWTLVQPFPFIWSKGYQGIASDTRRRPRHVYETALMFSRGDRKLVKLDKDHFEASVDEKLHMNQKPLPMLKHFLNMFVDEHTAVLDPTCGSGSALAAAKLMGASRILGVELDEDNADVARFLLQRHLPIEAADEKEPE